MKARAEMVEVGERLPDLALEAPDGTPAALRVRGRQAAVVVLVHDAACAECRDYLGQLAAADAEHREWDGRVAAVVPAPAGRVEALAAGLPFPVLADPGRCAGAALGIGGSAVLIADQWGELYSVSAAGDGHSLPAPAEITGWLRFLAIQCPECEGEAR